MTLRLSIADKLLIAAFEIEESGSGQFSAEDLVVSAWRKFPDAFGLQGYLDDKGKPIYPNSNRVYAEIMGSKPLRKQGLLQKVGNKMYRLTEAGRNRARLVSNSKEHETPEKWALARDKVDQIRRLFESKTAQKFRAGELEDISFFDVCGFWGISSRSGAKDLWSRFAHIESILEEAKKTLGSRQSVSSKHGSVPYTAEDIEGLCHMHKVLQQRFEKDIELIKRRKDERKI